ncbi:MAG: tRNA pseudouridine(13) synthase TruD [Halobacteriota archaeon]|nr:tRNA pseudouridine(13) synthase TruD [Halobacteriota archaeon]
MNEISPLENDVGIGIYTTTTSGMGGIIRQKTEDFRVSEITNREEGETGRYLILELVKDDWDNHHLIRDISRILRISQKRIGLAGTKDKRAITKQKISISDISEEEIERINLKGVKLEVIGRSNRPIVLGDLYGNEFQITIRDIDLEISELKERMSQTCDAIIEKSIGNFFGPQRFGTNRPVTHLVGDAIVRRGDFEKAAMTYIAKPFPGESQEARSAREYIWETGELKEGLKKMPLFLRYERAMLDYLIANPGDFKGSFGVLPKNLRNIFVHALQSVIFNKILTSRIRKGIPINKAVAGDVVCFKNDMGFPDVRKMQKVTSDNLDGINNLIRRKRAFVTAPIVGYQTEITDGVEGDVEREVLEDLSIKPEYFRIDAAPDFSSKGLRREISLFTDIKYTLEPDEINNEKYKVDLMFSLPKGSYATVVLREFIKDLN